ncbi:hypothetical protein HDU76_005378, partial [Blyttiomyces sp. JEL0837]
MRAIPGPSRYEDLQWDDEDEESLRPAKPDRGPLPSRITTGTGISSSMSFKRKSPTTSKTPLSAFTNLTTRIAKALRLDTPTSSSTPQTPSTFNNAPSPETRFSRDTMDSMEDTHSPRWAPDSTPLFPTSSNPRFSRTSYSEDNPGIYHGPSRPLRPGPPMNSGDGNNWSGYTDRRVAYDDFSTIDWNHDVAKERLRSLALRRIPGLKGRVVRAVDFSAAWVVVFIIGVLTGWSAGIIDVASNWLSDIKEGYCSEGYYLSRKFCCWHRPENEYCHEWITWDTAMGVSDNTGSWFIQCIMYTIWGTLFATIAATLVKFYAPYASGEGIPEIKTILGGFVIRKFLGVWTLLVKFLGITLSVGSGLSLGKEGPLVHLACCFGNIVPRTFEKYARNEAKRREILSAASAAGISVAFGAPVGGVLFSLEEISYYFPFKTMFRSFFCAMVGAIALRLMNPFRTGKLVWFQVTFSRDWHFFELPMFILLGVIGGLCGTLFIRLQSQVSALRKSSWIGDKPILEVLIVAVATGIIGYSHVYLSTPSMAIGACIGRAAGIIMQELQNANPDNIFFSSCITNARLHQPNTPNPISNTNPQLTQSQCVTPATYAMVGAAAFLAGTTRITVSLVIIMFELTGALSYVLPIIITVLTAKWVGDAGGKGLYDWLISVGGYPFLDSGKEYFGEEKVGEVMTGFEELSLITGNGFTVESLEELIKKTRFKGYPVIHSLDDPKLIGFAGHAELRYALAAAKSRETVSPETQLNFSENVDLDNEDYEMDRIVDMRPWIEHTPTTIPTDFPLELCVELFKKLGLRYVIVTDKGKLAGIITKKDLLRH